MRPTPAALVLTAALALTLAACSSSDPTPSPSTASPTETTETTTPTPDDPVPTTDEALPTPEDGPGDVGEDDPVESVPTAVWDEQSAATAIEAATTTVAAFLRTDVDAEQWWAELTPHLTPEYAAALGDVDLATLTGTGPTRPAVLEGENVSPYVARVRVPTDAGDLLVTLTRADDAQTWLATAIDAA